MTCLNFNVVILLMTILLGACTHKTPQSIHEEKNAVYYWKTIFHLDQENRSFMEKHQVGRIYLRMFDVTPEQYAYSAEEKTVPNASVRIESDDYDLLKDSLTSMEFVPVVYITLDALKKMKGEETLLASLIVTRVRNMVQYNELPQVEELQLDCDWTASTESSFFQLCNAVKQCMAEMQLPWRLSSTIRLHQLAGQVPPVDCGVLMLYNTGSFNDPDESNSIISLKHVEPYLKYLSSYPLHLDVAYPTYSWQLLFHHERQFIGLIQGLDLSDTTRFCHEKGNTYRAHKDIPYNNRIIRMGSRIREERSSFDEIAVVKHRVEAQLAGRNHSSILYHLDSQNLSNYSFDEIQSLYSVNH